MLLNLLGDAFSDVVASLQAVDAGVQGIWRDGDGALATEDHWAISHGGVARHIGSGTRDAKGGSRPVIMVMDRDVDWTRRQQARVERSFRAKHFCLLLFIFGFFPPGPLLFPFSWAVAVPAHNG